MLGDIDERALTDSILKIPRDFNGEHGCIGRRMIFRETGLQFLGQNRLSIQHSVIEALWRIFLKSTSTYQAEGEERIFPECQMIPCKGGRVRAILRGY